MANRSPRSARHTRRARPARLTVAANLNLTLWEALLAALDTQERDELVRLHSRYPWIFLEPNAERARHDELWQRGENGLRARLRTGEWVASGYDPQQQVNSQRMPLPPERSPHADLDIDRSSLTVAGSRLIEVVVSTGGGLYLSPSRRVARYGITTLRLGKRLFGLLLVLAKAANDRRPATPEDFQKAEAAFSDQKVVSQAIGKLRRHLRDRCTPQDELWWLIETIQGTGGYRLALPPERVSIEP